MVQAINIGQTLQPMQVPQQNVAATILAGEQVKQQRQGLAQSQQGLDLRQQAAGVATQRLNLDQLKLIQDQQTRQREAAISQMQTLQSIQGAVIPGDINSFNRAVDNVTSLFGEDIAKGIRDKFPSGMMNEGEIKQSQATLRGMIGKLEATPTPGAGQFTLGDQRFTAEGEEIARAVPEPGDVFGEPYLDESGNLMQKNTSTGKINRIAAPPKGMVIESDGAGGFTMRTGVPTTGTTGMQRKTATDIEGELLTATKGLSRLTQIENKFNEDFLQVPNKFNFELDALKAKFKGGKTLTKDEKQGLTEFTSFRQEALSNLNLYIKEITGAQMSNAEADRLKAAMPDPGKPGLVNILTGDSDIEFKSKMDSVAQQLRLSAARLNYIRNNGFTITRNKDGDAVRFADGNNNNIEISSMPRIMAEREAEIIQSLRAKLPDTPIEETNQMAFDRLAEEFGLLAQ